MTEQDGSKVSWRDYVDAELTSIRQAVAIAAGQMDRRLDGMNHLQAVMKDMANHMVDRNAFGEFAARTAEDIRSLRESRAEFSGKASQQSVNRALLIALIGVFLSVMGIVVAILGLLIRISQGGR